MDLMAKMDLFSYTSNQRNARVWAKFHSVLVLILILDLCMKLLKHFIDYTQTSTACPRRQTTHSTDTKTK